jgi:hypothetical protein
MGAMTAMTEPYYTYGICSICGVRTESPASLGTRFVQTLDALSRIDPLCANWEIIDARALSSSSLAAARSRITAIVENNVARNEDNFNKPIPRYGYHASARTNMDRDPRNVSFGFEGGGELNGSTKLEFGDYKLAPDLTVVTYPRFKAALLAINAAWLPQYAFAYAHRVGFVRIPFKLGNLEAHEVKGVPQVPGDPTFPDDFYIPWIFYLSAPFAAGLKLAPEFQTERTPDGGLLLIATKDRLDPSNPGHIRCARVLAETLIACRGISSR